MPVGALVQKLFKMSTLNLEISKRKDFKIKEGMSFWGKNWKEMLEFGT